MIDEAALRDTLLALAVQAKTNYLMLSSVLTEVVALRETVRGDPTFADIFDQKRQQSAPAQLEVAKLSIAAHDDLIRRLESGAVC